MIKEKGHTNFDDLIKQKFDGHNPKVPKGLWENIDNKAALLETADLRKKVVFYRWASVVLVLFAIGIIAVYEWPEDKIASTQEEQPVITAINKDVSPVIEYKEEVRVNNTTKFDESAIKPSRTKSSVTTASSVLLKESKTDIQLTKNSKTQYESPKIEKSLLLSDTPQNTENNQPSEEIIEGASKENENIILANESKIVEKEVETASAQNELVSRQEELIFDKTEASNTENLISKGAEIEEQKEIIKEPQLLEDETTMIADNLKPNNEEYQDEMLEKPIPVDSVMPEPKDVIGDNITEEVTKVKAGKFAVSILAFPSIPQTTFNEGNGFSETALYESGEKEGVQWGPSVVVSYSPVSRVSLNVGVNFTGVKDEFELTDVRPHELPITISPANKTLEIYSALGNTQLIGIDNVEFAGDDEDDVDLDDEDDFASLNFKEQYEFRFVNIPITVGYELGKGKLRVLAQAGVQFSFVSKAGSKVEISNVSRSTQVATVEDYHETKSMSTGITVGAGLKYNFSKRFSAVFIPQYNKSITNLIDNGGAELKLNSMVNPFGIQFQF